MDNNNLVIDRTLASRLSAAALLVGFTLFVGGYFVGKRQGFQEFMTHLEKESLTDQVYATVSSLYDESQEPGAPLLDEPPKIKMQLHVESTEKLQAPVETPEQPKHEVDTRYYGQLASYRRTQDARPLMERLKKQGIDTEIKEVASRTKKGRTQKWFQVVTLSYSNKKELQKLIDTIKKIEKIPDIVLKKETKHD